MGVTGLDLGSTVSRPHAGEAWLAPLSIQAQINANQSVALMHSDAIKAFTVSKAPNGGDALAYAKSDLG